MMVTAKRQQGFTLIELSVVVMIVATMAAMSVLAINQAFDRRYSSEADKLLTWLQQLAEYSALQGAAYGVIAQTSELSELTQLRAVIYYRKRWVAVVAPQPFDLSDDARIDWLVQQDDDNPLLPQEEQQGRDLTGLGAMEAEQEQLLLPEIAFLPDGYIEPQGDMRLSFGSSEVEYSFQWGEAGAQIQMRRVQP
jgi:prepilin-type N-terminal cleavage/methylation domain-containing protein